MDVEIKLAKEELLAVCAACLVVTQEIKDGKQKTNDDRKKALLSGTEKLLDVWGKIQGEEPRLRDHWSS